MIVKSEITNFVGPEVDGRFWVTETHTRDDDSSFVVITLCEPDLDYVSIMNQRAQDMNQQEKESVIDG